MKTSLAIPRLTALLGLACLGPACSPPARVPDASLHVYDLDTGEKAFSLQGHNRPTTALAISADGQFVLTGSLTRELRLWSLLERREVRAIDPYLARAVEGPGPYLGTVHTLRFLDGTQLALVGHESTGFGIWNLESNAVTRTFRTRVRDASTVVISGDGDLVMATDPVQPKAISWGLAEGEPRATYEEHWQGNSPYVTLSRSGRPRSWWHCATGEVLTDGNPVSVGNQLQNGQCLLSPDGRRLLTYYGGVENQTNIHRIRLWDLESSRLLLMRSGITLPISYSVRPYSRCRSLAFSPDSSQLAIGLRDGRIEVRAVDGGQLVKDWAMPPRSCEVVLFLPDGKRLITWGDSTMRLWEMATGTLVRSFPVPVLTEIASTPDGRWLVVGGTGAFAGL